MWASEFYGRVNLVAVIAMITLSFIDKKPFNMNVQAEINQNFQNIRRTNSGWECELRSNFPSPGGEGKYDQQAKCPHVLYVKPFNKVFIIPLFCHFLVFWILPAVTENHITCIIRLVLEWINEMTSDKRWQAKFSGFASYWKQFISLKNSRSVHICTWPNMVKWRKSGIIRDGHTL